MDAGATTHAPDLELLEKSLVMGIVRTAGGAPAPGAFVRAGTGQASLSSEHEGLHCGSFARETRADEDGRFRIEDVPAGSVHLGVSLMRGRGESELVAHLEPGLNLLDLQLPLDSWLVVEVVDRAGTRKACEVGARDASGKRHRAEQDGAGLYWVGALPPGPYTVEVEVGTTRIERSVTLARGEGRHDITIQVE